MCVNGWTLPLVCYKVADLQVCPLKLFCFRGVKEEIGVGSNRFSQLKANTGFDCWREMSIQCRFYSWIG